jgi:hypothetical protein
MILEELFFLLVAVAFYTLAMAASVGLPVFGVTVLYYELTTENLIFWRFVVAVPCACYLIGSPFFLFCVLRDWITLHADHDPYAYRLVVRAPDSQKAFIRPRPRCLTTRFICGSSQRRSWS